MLKLIKATDLDMDFVLNFKLENIEDVYIVMYNGEKAGVLEYKEKIKYFSEGEVECSLYIEYIEILKPYRRKGIATEVIKSIFKDNIDYMYGNAIPSSLDFWKTFNADFGGEDENIEYYLENNVCLSFVI